MVKYPWDDEPTPQTDRELRASGETEEEKK